MPIKLKKNSEYLSTTKFPISARGCYAYEVDTVFDQIIKDYETVENNQLLSNEEYKELISQIEKLKAENIELRVELDNEKSRWKYIKNEGKDIHVDNLELLRRTRVRGEEIHWLCLFANLPLNAIKSVSFPNGIEI